MWVRHTKFVSDTSGSQERSSNWNIQIKLLKVRIGHLFVQEVFGAFGSRTNLFLDHIVFRYKKHNWSIQWWCKYDPKYAKPYKTNRNTKLQALNIHTAPLAAPRVLLESDWLAYLISQLQRKHFSHPYYVLATGLFWTYVKLILSIFFILLLFILCKFDSSKLRISFLTDGCRNIQRWLANNLEIWRKKTSNVAKIRISAVYFSTFVRGIWTVSPVPVSERVQMCGKSCGLHWTKIGNRSFGPAWNYREIVSFLFHCC